MADEIPIPTIPAVINAAGYSTADLPNHGWRVFLPLVIMIVLSGLTVAARIGARVSARQLGADDYAIMAALASCVIQTSFWGKSIQTGYGADYLLLTTPQRQEFNKWWFFGNIFYPITLALFKTSVILLSKRIFVQEGFQKLCWATLLVNTCWAVGNVLSTIFQCVPIPIMWGVVPVTEGTCWGQNALWISIVTWDVTSDVWIMGMALPMIWKLNLRFREKAMLTSVFMLGAVVIIFSILSCSAVAAGLAKQGVVKNHYTFALANLFQVLESNMGIIGACLPILKQPLKRFVPKLFTKVRSQGYYYTDDRDTQQYQLRNIGAKDSKNQTWHSVSVSGPELFKSTRKGSDELEMIGEEGSGDKGSALSSDSRADDGIRKQTTVTVGTSRARSFK